MSRILLSTLAAAVLAAPVAAHHETAGKSHAIATVTITEAVKADEKALAPGTYEVWLLDERPNLTGAASNAQRVVELHQNGKIIAKEVAEVFGLANARLARRERLAAWARPFRRCGGEFLRISISDGGARYLIHLPTAELSRPRSRRRRRASSTTGRRGSSAAAAVTSR